MFSLFFLIVFLFLIIFMNFKNDMNFEVKTFFECGFESVQTYRSLFSLRFFSVSIIFLIFDLEIMFILPTVLFYNNFKFFLFIIYLVLCFGLILEWNQGGFVWK